MTMVAEPSPVLGGRYSWFLFMLAVLLLGLYILAVMYLVLFSLCSGGRACATLFPSVPPEGVVLAATTVGGLVSALVISVLAVTEPVKRPGTAFAMPGESAPRKELAVDIYLVAWLLAGMTAFVVGPMLGIGDDATLRDLGLTWLGTAVASMYTYFGIRREQPIKDPAEA